MLLKLTPDSLVYLEENSSLNHVFLKDSYLPEGSYKIEEITKDKIFCHSINSPAARTWLLFSENPNLEITLK